MNNIITFNVLKHHLSEIRYFIAKPPQNYLEILKTIGSSLPDLYTGKLSVEEIKTEISNQLIAHHLVDRELFIGWVEKAGGYRKLILSDNSKWILRVSENKEQFVHIHPGRYSQHSVRVKSEALKTAIVYLIENKENYNTPDTTQKFNELRKKVELSPIKNFNNCLHLEKIISIIKHEN